MKAAHVTLAAMLAGLSLAVVGADAAIAASGRIATLQRGHYACEKPGDASTQRGIPVPEEGFTITNGSAYSAGGKSGTYLRTDDTVIMTSGPKKGDRYTVRNERYLREVDEAGKPTGLRCVRQG